MGPLRDHRPPAVPWLLRWWFFYVYVVGRMPMDLEVEMEAEVCDVPGRLSTRTL